MVFAVGVGVQKAGDCGKCGPVRLKPAEAPVVLQQRRPAALEEAAAPPHDEGLSPPPLTLFLILDIW